MENTATSSQRKRYNVNSQILKIPASNQKKIEDLQNPRKAKKSITAATIMRASLLQNIERDKCYTPYCKQKFPRSSRKSTYMLSNPSCIRFEFFSVLSESVLEAELIFVKTLSMLL